MKIEYILTLIVLLLCSLIMINTQPNNNNSFCKDCMPLIEIPKNYTYINNYSFKQVNTSLNNLYYKR